MTDIQHISLERRRACYSTPLLHLVQSCGLNDRHQPAKFLHPKVHVSLLFFFALPVSILDISVFQNSRGLLDLYFTNRCNSCSDFSICICRFTLPASIFLEYIWQRKLGDTNLIAGGLLSWLITFTE